MPQTTWSIDTPARAMVRERPATAWRPLAGLVMLAATAAGGGTDSAGRAGPGPAPNRVDAAWAEVEALVATPRCRNDSDCRSVGVGSRACGGPQKYLAWSRLVTDEAALHRAVARHAALRQAADEKAGLSSTCEVIEEPAVHCRKPLEAGAVNALESAGAGGAGTAAGPGVPAVGVCVTNAITGGPSGNASRR